MIASDVPTTASREHAKHALERPCRSVLPSARRCAAWTTSMQTDVRPRVEAGLSALVALPSVLVALPFALAAIGQQRAALPVETSVALEETQSVGL